MRLEGKVAIVTGAGSGIGRGIALRLASEGAKVAVADINLDGAKQTVEQIKAAKGSAIALKTDVSRSDQVNEMTRAVLDKFGQIDILVNNAGGSAREKRSPFWESTEEIWDPILNVNLRGTFICTRAVINHMLERRSGKIVSIASICGVNGCTLQGAYSAAKAGIIGFTKALAKEVSTYGIAVNCVSPGVIGTPGTAPRREELMDKFHQFRLGEPADIAAAVAFLASDEASFIVGQNYIVCGGSSLGF